MKSQLYRAKVSRREILRVGIVGAFLAFERCTLNGRAHAASVKLIIPPDWLPRAFDTVRAIQAPCIPSRVVRIAQEDGDTRELIQSAIEKVSALGGGKISLAPGMWRIRGPLVLRSRTEIHLEEGATLVFSGDRADYLPPVVTRWEGTDLYGYSPCIYADSVTDIAVTGRGSLQMERGGDIESWRFEQAEARRKLRMMGATGVPLEQRIFAPQGFLRPSFIQFLRCERTLVQGVKIKEIAFWGVHILYSRHATVRAVRIESDRVNNDGVDIDSSSYVLVEGCTFKTGDDCIAIKSGRDYDGRKVGIPSEHIIIRDCRMERSGSAGIAIGSEMSGGVRYVYIFRCDMGKVQTVFNIKSNLDRGGFVEGVRVWNISAEECSRLIQVTTSYHGYQGGKIPPRFEDIEIEDMRCKRAKEGISIRGVPLSPVKRLVLKQLSISHVQHPSSIAHVEQFRCDDVRMNGELLSCVENES